MGAEEVAEPEVEEPDRCRRTGGLPREAADRRRSSHPRPRQCHPPIVTEVKQGEAARIGGPDVTLSAEQVSSFIAGQLAGAPVDGRSVCVLVPDATRSCPLPCLLSAVHGALHGRVSALTFLVALGTHSELSEAALAAHLGYEPGASAVRYPDTTVLNHRWQDPATFAPIGTITAARVAEVSGGLLRQDVPVRINRAVIEHDVALVVGPVF